jgi:hypothetical protein
LDSEKQAQKRAADLDAVELAQQQSRSATAQTAQRSAAVHAVAAPSVAQEPSEPENPPDAVRVVRVLYQAVGAGLEERIRRANAFRNQLAAAGVTATVAGTNFKELKSQRERPKGAVQIVYRQYERPLGTQVQKIIDTGTPLFSRSLESGTVTVWVF